MQEFQTHVMLNDIQFPFQDSLVLDRLVKPFVQELKPRSVKLNGDITDCHLLSVFDKNPMTKEGLLDEIKLSGALMSWTSKAVTNPEENEWNGGNHEDRMRRYMWANAPVLVETGIVDFDKVFKCSEYGYTYYPYMTKLRLGKLMWTHGSIVRQESGASAKAHFLKYGCSVIIGHTHRLGQYFKTNDYGEHAAYENGHLCDMDKVEYVKDPDWQEGFAVIQVYKDGTFNVEQCKIILQGDKKFFIYGGERYSTVLRKSERP